MQRKYSVLVIILALTLLASACAPQAASSGGSVPVTGHTSAPMPAYGGSGSSSSQASSPTKASSSGSSSSASGPAQLAVGQNASLGSFLMDSKGMTLYLYTKDTPNTSNCYDKCASFWPPLLTSGAAVAGNGLDASKLGTTMRKDGTTQVTYNGWPLYYYAKDKQAGDVVGQKVGGVWFVVSPSGDAVK